MNYPLIEQKRRFTYNKIHFNENKCTIKILIIQKTKLK